MYMNGWKDGSLTDGLSVKLALRARAVQCKVSTRTNAYKGVVLA